ncbi:permeases of the major facilitator superfamily [Stylonychia lemnae]|uniref:Permeases of the major facilitator superfamily n=1 Tax=Stylonychia lemnae TaxID=5949 RepID=A0A077ZQD8_STYLE|nr:permeases of the major facilitator superfamily [Stylonychia lemnae]|eukprot:CDW71679.1 permeases of the major facilitator superfamily [Stylonychia lemnae]
MAQFGRKNAMLLAFSQSLLATLGLGFCSYIDNEQYRQINRFISFLFFLASMLLRFYQGFSDGIVCAACFAIASAEFSKTRGEVAGYLEAAIGFGLMMGPSIGQTFYSLTTYQLIFFGFAALLIFSTISTVLFLPSRVNKTQGQSEESLAAQDVEDVSYYQILKNKKVAKSLIFTIIGMIVMHFNQMLITNQLTKIGVPFNLTGTYTFFKNDLIGYIIGISGLAYFIFSIVSGIMVNRFENSYLVQSSFITITVTLLLQGSPEDSLPLMIIGLVIMGLSIAFLFTSFLRNIITAVQQKEEIDDDTEQLVNKASILYNISLSAICLCSPLLGGYLSDNFRYTKSCQKMGQTSFFLSILYFLANLKFENTII